MNVSTGIQLLDQRTGGLRDGGVYVLAGAPGSGKLTAILQFLQVGLAAGERVVLLSGNLPRELLEQAAYWGFPLEQAWRAGQLRILGFADDFDRLLLSSADPNEAFAELGRLAGADASRLGIDPGKPLWETRAGTSLGNRFIRWAQSLHTTTLATLTSDLSDTLSPATEWVLQSASGVFKIERLASGLRQLWIRRITPPTEHQGAVTLELVPGKGFQEPSGRLERRRTDAPLGSERRLLLLNLSSELPTDLSGWAKDRFEAVIYDQPLRLVSRLQDGETFGVIVIYLDKTRSREALDACRAIRPLTAAPIIMAADDRLRASDRTQALDLGANDFLSDSFSIGELASRIDRAIESVRGLPRRPSTYTETSEPEPTALLNQQSFVQRVEQQLGAARGTPFTLVFVSPTEMIGSKIGEILTDQVRGDVGDFVGETASGFGVVLQGARPRQARAFIDRVHTALEHMGDGKTDLQVRVLSSSSDSGRISELLRNPEA